MSAPTALDSIVRAYLLDQGLDPKPFESLATTLSGGGAPDSENRIASTVRAPVRDDVRPLPALGTDERRALAEKGESAIRRGEIGVVVLAGGMATRFGGTVKALVPVLGDATFLDLKLADVERLRARLHAQIPFACMTSFATDAMVRAALRDRADASTFQQFDAPRLEADGSLFRDAKGELSRYATGHGDLTFALRARGTLGELRARGVRTLLVSNVDNLTATLDPAVVGAHRESGAAITVEVAPKRPGDKGGAPAYVDGKLQIIESFRFPTSFDQDSIPVFNTNTLLLDTAAIDRDFPLTWFAVKKTVDGRDAYQLERLVGELTAFLPSSYLLVERDGDDARFQPVKEVADLPRQAPIIARALRARGALD